MKTCDNCQNILHDSANFCNMCGHSDFTPVPEEPEIPVEELLGEPAPAPEEAPAPKQPATDAYYADGGIPVPPVPQRRTISKGAILGICGAATALIAIVVLILVLTNPVRRFMSHVRAGDPAAASEIYSSAILGSESRVEKANAQLSAYVNDQLALYMDQEITYEDLTAKLRAIDAAGLANDSVYGALQQAAYICDCRETYDAAAAAYDGGDYGMAAALFAQVADADFEHGAEAAARLEDATSLYRAQVLEEVSGYIAGNAYTSAQALLSEAFGILPGDAALEEAYDACLQAEQDYTIQCLIEEARVYMDAGDYPGAIAFLDEQIAAHPEEASLQEEKAACMTRFEEYVINGSYQAAGGDFAGAAALTASGLEYFTSEKVSELDRIYVSHLPVALGDMAISQNETKGGALDSETNKTDQYLEDKVGGVYTHSFSVGCGSVTYNVNQSYQTLSGTVAFPKSLETDATRKSATLTIYGDGKELAVFRKVTAATAPEAFSLDISACAQITLSWEVEGSGVWKDWGDFATIFDGTLTPIPLALPESVG
ncbi:MAG: NPCBM/NEW2 domain-containing protein [Oscillospiraceae bacterium]|nr:NPCBM/NEW2 domain-containing protein [Oscillospiraceae bacterium]